MLGIIVIEIFLVILTAILFYCALITYKDEKYFKENAVYTFGKNVTKSYCDKQNATDKLILVTLPDGSEMQMRSNQFNQIKAIPLGAMVRIGYVVKNTWGIRTYEMRLMEDQYMRKRRISPVILLWSLTVLFLIVTIVLLIYAIMIGENN